MFLANQEGKEHRKGYWVLRYDQGVWGIGLIRSRGFGGRRYGIEIINYGGRVEFIVIGIFNATFMFLYRNMN